MTAITKNQHYVPRLLLKKFSTKHSSEFRVNVLDLERDEYRKNQNIKNVCSGNYTYDKDNSFEEFLSEHIEGPATEAIESILINPHEVSSIPDENLLRFIIAQAARTRQAYEGGLDFINSAMKTIIQESARLNGLDQSISSRIRIEPNDPSVLLSYMTAHAVFHYRLISDLSVAIVVNKTNQEFILSDHPVFQCNWYLKDESSPLATAYSANGCQFFLPLSPSITYCLYDPSIYLYKTCSNSSLIIATESDVSILNSFQAINASELLIAQSDRMRTSLEGFGKKYANSKPFISNAIHSQATEREDGSLRSTHLTWREQTCKSSLPSFIKIKNKVRRREITHAHRRPDIVIAHEAALAKLRVNNS